MEEKKGETMTFIIAVVWIILAFVVAKAAKEKNRSYGWFLFLGLITSPLVSGFILLVLGRKKVAVYKPSYDTSPLGVHIDDSNDSIPKDDWVAKH